MCGRCVETWDRGNDCFFLLSSLPVHNLPMMPGMAAGGPYGFPQFYMSPYGAAYATQMAWYYNYYGRYTPFVHIPLASATTLKHLRVDCKEHPCYTPTLSLFPLSLFPSFLPPPSLFLASLPSSHYPSFLSLSPSFLLPLSLPPSLPPSFLSLSPSPSFLLPPSLFVASLSPSLPRSLPRQPPGGPDGAQQLGGNEADVGVNPEPVRNNEEDQVEEMGMNGGGLGMVPGGGLQRQRDIVDYIYMLMMAAFLVAVAYLTGSLGRMLIFAAGIIFMLL